MRQKQNHASVKEERRGWKAGFWSLYKNMTDENNGKHNVKSNVNDD